MIEGKVHVENPANCPMHYGDFTSGRVVPPDYVPKYRIYTYFDAEDRYNEIQHDIYEDSKKIKPKSKREFPKILKFIAVGIGAIAAFLGVKKASEYIIKLLKK